MDSEHDTRAFEEFAKESADKGIRQALAGEDQPAMPGRPKTCPNGHALPVGGQGHFYCPVCGIRLPDTEMSQHQADMYVESLMEGAFEQPLPPPRTPARWRNTLYMLLFLGAVFGVTFGTAWLLGADLFGLSDEEHPPLLGQGDRVPAIATSIPSVPPTATMVIAVPPTATPVQPASAPPSLPRPTPPVTTAIAQFDVQEFTKAGMDIGYHYILLSLPLAGGPVQGRAVIEITNYPFGLIHEAVGQAATGVEDERYKEWAQTCKVVMTLTADVSAVYSRADGRIDGQLDLAPAISDTTGCITKGPPGVDATTEPPTTFRLRATFDGMSLQGNLIDSKGKDQLPFSSAFE